MKYRRPSLNTLPTEETGIGARAIDTEGIVEAG
jgi:hypothetical protein